MKPGWMPPILTVLVCVCAGCASSAPAQDDNAVRQKLINPGKIDLSKVPPNVRAKIQAQMGGAAVSKQEAQPPQGAPPKSTP